jgi:hypothetical protein
MVNEMSDFLLPGRPILLLRLLSLDAPSSPPDLQPQTTMATTTTTTDELEVQKIPHSDAGRGELYSGTDPLLLISSYCCFWLMRHQHRLMLLCFSA